MRSALTLAAFLSLPALACPQLAGTYSQCKSNSSSETEVKQIMIEQKVENKITQYTFSTHDVEADEVRIEKYIADGKGKTATETNPETGITIKTNTAASCAGAVLKIKMVAEIDAAEFANVVIQISRVENKLVQSFSGTSMGQPVGETVTCELNRK